MGIKSENLPLMRIWTYPLCPTYKNYTPVAPLGLWGGGYCVFYIPAAPLGLKYRFCCD